MDVSTVIAIIGGIALLVGVFGGGIELKELKVPPINSTLRIISFVLGVILIVGAVIVSKPEFLSLIPAQPSGSVTIPTPDPTKPLLSDNFDDSAYDGSYNTSVWNCSGCQLGIGIIKQEKGSVHVESSKVGQSLVAQSSWTLEQINYLQADMKLESTDALGGFINLNFGTSSTLGPWQTMCSIMGSQNPTGKTIFGCEVCTTINGQYKCDYNTEAYPVNYGDWYTTKIEIMPKTLELRFYLDNKLIGQYTPANANELKNNFCRVSFGTNADANIVGDFDNVIVQPAK